MTDAESHVRKWLEKQGYPLEYEAARILRKRGFRAWQGVHYRDEESSEPRSREIDVVASEPPPEGKGKAVVELALEAKHTHEPWLILTSQIDTDRPVVQPQWLFMNREAEDPVRTLLKTDPVTDLLRLNATHGFNVVQTWESKDPDRPNPAYIALQGAVKAADARLRLRHGFKVPTVLFAVIVVGGSLVQLGYDETGDPVLEAVPSQRVRWGGSTVVHHQVIVDIVQRDSFDEWTERAKASTTEIMGLLSSWVTSGAPQDGR